MAQMQINIPDAVMPDVVDALAARGGYDHLMVPEGETKPPKPQFAKDQVIDFIKTVTRHHKAEAVAQAARDTEYGSIDAALDLS